jgi:hypothetical protein
LRLFEVSTFSDLAFFMCFRRAREALRTLRYIRKILLYACVPLQHKPDIYPVDMVNRFQPWLSAPWRVRPWWDDLDGLLFALSIVDKDLNFQLTSAFNSNNLRFCALGIIDNRNFYACSTLTGTGIEYGRPRSIKADCSYTNIFIDFISKNIPL